MNGKFLTLIQENLIEVLLTWFLLGRVLRRVVAVNQRAGILCPRSPRGTGGKGTVFSEEEDIPLAERVCFVASDVLTTICHLAIVNVCVIIILSIGNTQISILLLCFLYLFVELMFMMNE